MAITTNKQYLESTLERFNVSENDIDIIIAENPELNGALDVKLCKLAMYKSMSTILPLANISEGGYSITWNMDALKLWYKALCSELGKKNMLDGQPKIRDKSNLW